MLQRLKGYIYTFLLLLFGEETLVDSGSCFGVKDSQCEPGCLWATQSWLSLTQTTPSHHLRPPHPASPKPPVRTCPGQKEKLTWEKSQEVGAGMGGDIVLYQLKPPLILRLQNVFLRSLKLLGHRVPGNCFSDSRKLRFAAVSGPGGSYLGIWGML